jgi:hypothetical protein
MRRRSVSSWRAVDGSSPALRPFVDIDRPAAAASAGVEFFDWDVKADALRCLAPFEVVQEKLAPVRFAPMQSKADPFLQRRIASLGGEPRARQQ